MKHYKKHLQFHASECDFSKFFSGDVNVTWSGIHLWSVHRNGRQMEAKWEASSADVGRFIQLTAFWLKRHGHISYNTVHCGLYLKLSSGTSYLKGNGGTNGRRHIFRGRGSSRHIWLYVERRLIAFDGRTPRDQTRGAPPDIFVSIKQHPT